MSDLERAPRPFGGARFAHAAFAPRFSSFAFRHNAFHHAFFHHRFHRFNRFGTSTSSGCCWRRKPTPRTGWPSYSFRRACLTTS